MNGEKCFDKARPLKNLWVNLAQRGFEDRRPQNSNLMVRVKRKLRAITDSDSQLKKTFFFNLYRQR